MTVKFAKLLLILVFGVISLAVGSETLAERKDVRPPNILLVIADDMGISDLGAFGSEIETPNLDSIAEQGLRFTQFHVNNACSPTRSMLLTGVDSHLTGYGTMFGLETDEQRGKPGYELYLNDDVLTVADLLSSHGYHTSISGKWDQGGRNAQGSVPNERGFERSFVLIEGLADHFRLKGGHHKLSPPTYMRDGAPVDLPDDFYSSKTYADYAIRYISEAKSLSKPFFSILSFTAPHYPLQARPATVQKYRGMYGSGYAHVRSKRLQKMESLGLIPSGLEAAPFHPSFPDWEDLDDDFQSWESRRMEVYAAMIDDLDQEFGRVVQHLSEIGELENTVIVFMSDNGPEAGNPLDYGAGPYLADHYDLSADGLGAKDGFTWYGPGWAAVSAGPYRLFKHFMTNGGVLSPLIIRLPNNLRAGELSHELISVKDLLPTFMDIAGYGTWQSQVIARGAILPNGKSIMPHIRTRASVHSDDYVLSMELFNRRMLRKGDWKLVWANAPWGQGLGRWALYNLKLDPYELHDVAKQNPFIVNQLLEDWDEWADSVGAVFAPEFVLPIANDDSHYQWRPAFDTRSAKK